MMIPAVVRTDQLAPLKATRAVLHEMAAEFAVEHFERHGYGPFVWLLGCGPRVVWIETNWTCEPEKEYAVHYVRKVAKAMHADCYAFISEAWVAVYKTAELDKADRPKPSQRPKAERDDIMIVISVDKAGDQANTRWLVTQRRHGPNFLGPRVDITDGPMTSGRMFGILEDA